MIKKIMFGFIKKMFLGLLASKVNASQYTKCVYLSNQECLTQPTLYILMNIVKDNITIHLPLIKIECCRL